MKHMMVWLHLPATQMVLSIHQISTVSAGSYQTDLTALVLSLEQDNKRLTTELAVVRFAKGYPARII